jgi:hypothetical protein
MLNPIALKELIETGGIAFKEGAISFVFTCPRCSKARKLYLRKSDGRFVCFVCRETTRFQGKAEYALAEIYGRPIEEIRERLYGKKNQEFKAFLNLDLKDPYESYSEEEFGFEEPLPSVAIPPDFVDSNHLLFEKGRNYLLNRGINRECIEQYGIMYHPQWRTVVFPVIIDNELVGWQERSIADNFRYTLKGFKKDRVLMFQDRLNNSEHAVLCEGPVDAIKAHYCGGNVAAMGKGVSPQQLEIIKNKVKKLYIALDPDAATEIDKICRSMYDYLEVYLMPPPKGRKDMGESTFEEALEQFKNAQKYCGQFHIYLKNPWK